MKNLFLIVTLLFFAHLGWNAIQSFRVGPPAPLHDTPYVVVYGRDTCGITQRARAKLDRLQVPYEYKSVDAPGVGDELHPRMQAAGLDTRRYGLPVIDVNSEIMIRPPTNQVAAKYQASVERVRPAAASSEAGPDSSAQSATSDPLVQCSIGGEKTWMLQSQCDSGAPGL